MIATTKFGLEKFKIISLAQGSYVTSGPINGKPWVSYIDSSGIKKWDFEGKEMGFAIEFDLGSNGRDCFIVSSVIVLDEKSKPSNTVRVIKFRHGK